MTINPETGLPVLPEGLEWFIEPWNRYGLQSHAYIHIGQWKNGTVYGDQFGLNAKDYLVYESTPRWATKKKMFGENRYSNGEDFRGLTSLAKHYIFVEHETEAAEKILKAAQQLLRAWNVAQAGEAEAARLNASLQTLSGSYPPNTIADNGR